MKPTRKQLVYLRGLADKTATTFTYPSTSAAATAEIRRLKAMPRSQPGDTKRETRAIQRDLANRPGDATAIRRDDVRGYGSSARWAHRPTDDQERS